MNLGDVVTRSSYHHDVPFLIEGITEQTILLSGLNHRLVADAPSSDLVPYASIRTEASPPSTPLSNETGELICTNTRYFSPGFFSRRRTLHPSTTVRQGSIAPRDYQGTILHIDGNKRYLSESLAKYKCLGIPVIGFSIEEEKQPFYMYQLLYQYRPNILVVTGHDAIKRFHGTSKDLDCYLNSKYYVTSIRIARIYQEDPNELVIIAGGCKSNYEALMDAGANFASSPNRVLINVTDPVAIACKLATTSSKKMLSMNMIADEIPSGTDGFGGIETRGQYKDAACE